MNILAIKEHAAWNHTSISELEKNLINEEKPNTTAVDKYTGIAVGKRKGVKNIEVFDHRLFFEFMMRYGFEVFENNDVVSDSDLLVKGYLGQDIPEKYNKFDGFFDGEYCSLLEENVKLKTIESVNGVNPKKALFFKNIHVSKIIDGYGDKDKNNPLAHALLADDSTDELEAKNSVQLKRLFYVTNKNETNHLALYQIKDAAELKPISYVIDSEIKIGHAASNLSTKPLISSPAFYFQAIQNFNPKEAKEDSNFDIKKISNQFEFEKRADYLSTIEPFAKKGFQIFLNSAPRDAKRETNVDVIRGINRAIAYEFMSILGLKK